MRSLFIGVAILAVWSPELAAAQTGAASANQLSEGRRVRVMTRVSDVWVAGTIERRTSDRIELRQDESESLWELPLESLRRVEVSAGHETQGTSGALFGMVIGALAGGFIASNFTEECVAGELLYDLCGANNVFIVVAGIGGGGLAGGLVGWLIGSSIKSERWKPIPIETVSLRVTPTDSGGAALAVAFHF